MKRTSVYFGEVLDVELRHGLVVLPPNWLSRVEHAGEVGVEIVA